MRRYVVELAFARAGHLRADELTAIARRSRRLADELGPGIEWRETYVGDDLIFVVYDADGEALVRQHVERLGLVPGTVAPVVAVIGPTSIDDLVKGP